MEHVKQCSDCKKTLPISSFNKRAASPDGYALRCRACRAIHRKKHSAKNHETKRIKVLAIRAEIDAIKEGSGCMKCGEPRHWVLDFHHRDCSAKDGSVSTHVNDANRKRALTEVEKCDILCSNCHRDLHYWERSAAQHAQ